MQIEDVPGLLLRRASREQETADNQCQGCFSRGVSQHIYSNNVYSSMTLPMASAHTVQNDSERVNIRQFCSDR